MAASTNREEVSAPPAISSAVIRLPTAAPKKVQQPSNRRASQASKALPQFPNGMTRWQREAATEKERLEARRAQAAEVDLTAAFRIIEAIGQVLTPRDQSRVALRLALGADTEQGQAACAFWETAVLPFSWKEER